MSDSWQRSKHPPFLEGVGWAMSAHKAGISPKTRKFSAEKTTFAFPFQEALQRLNVKV